MSNLPSDSEARKRMPVFSGFMNYFPRAIAAVAAHSLKANEKHNPGEPLHWSHEKSADHVDCIARHLLDLDTEDEFGDKHDISVAWRAMAMLETRLRNEESAQVDTVWIQTDAEAEAASAAFAEFCEKAGKPHTANVRIVNPLDMGLGGELKDVTFIATFNPLLDAYRVNTDRYEFTVLRDDIRKGYVEVGAP